jgi:hypothetical protein
MQLALQVSQLDLQHTDLIQPAASNVPASAHSFSSSNC